MKKISVCLLLALILSCVGYADFENSAEPLIAETEEKNTDNKDAEQSEELQGENELLFDNGVTERPADSELCDEKTADSEVIKRDISLHSGEQYGLSEYEAADAFNSSSNGDDNWKWQYFKQKDRDYTDLPNYSKWQNDTAGFSDDGSKTGDSWQKDNAAGYAVGKYWMRPTTNGADATLTDGICRTFTAPSSGNITITAKDLNGDSKIIGGNSGNDYGAFVRVVKNEKQVWPLKNAELRFTNEMHEIAFEPLGIDVVKGDKIYFEVYNNGNPWRTAWNGRVFWNPVIKYNYLSPDIEEIKPENKSQLRTEQEFEITFKEVLVGIEDIEFNLIGGNGEITDKRLSNSNKTLGFRVTALEYDKDYRLSLNNLVFADDAENAYQMAFDFDTAPKKVLPVYKSSDFYSEETPDGGIWKFGYYSKEDGYQLMKKFIQWAVIPAFGNGREGNAWGYSDGRGPLISAAYMRPDVNDNPANVSVVKTFVADNDGLITISADNGEGLKQIIGSTRNMFMGADLRIMKNSEKIWPLNADSIQIPQSGTVDFEDIQISVEKNDMIHFEVFIGKHTNDLWNKLTFWDPVIIYNEVYPKITDANLTDNETKVELNRTFTFKFDQEIAPISESDIVCGEDGYACDLQYNSDMTGISFKIKNLSEKTNYKLQLHNIRPYYVEDAVSHVYEYNFTTDSKISVGKVELNGGSNKLIAGNNVISAEVNNTAPNDAENVCILAVLMEGNPSEYRVVNSYWNMRNDLGEYDRLSLTVPIENPEGKFLKVIVCDKPFLGKAKTGISIYGGDN